MVAVMTVILVIGRFRGVASPPYETIEPELTLVCRLFHNRFTMLSTAVRRAVVCSSRQITKTSGKLSTCENERRRFRHDASSDNDTFG